MHLHARLGALLSQHARRSDVVISERVGRYLLLSPETDWPGALAMSQRVNAAVEQATTLRAAAPMSEAERTPSETHREAVAP